MTSKIGDYFIPSNAVNNITEEYYQKVDIISLRVFPDTKRSIGINLSYSAEVTTGRLASFHAIMPPPISITL